MQAPPEPELVMQRQSQGINCQEQLPIIVLELSRKRQALVSRISESEALASYSSTKSRS